MESEQYQRLYLLEETLWWFVGMRRIVAALLEGRAHAGMRCLEAGCGTGFNARFLAERYGWKVYPMDASRRALGLAQARGLSGLLQASITDLPYRDASFDAATCFDVLYLFSPERGARALAELARVLRAGGLLLVRTAALPALRGRHSELVHEAHRYSLSELCAAVRRAGFVIERSTYANALLLPLAVLKRRLLEPLGLVPLEGDVTPVAPWLNQTFGAALDLEAHLLRRGRDLPLGVSAMVFARKPG
jgi:SAM-dependent methyltransferase